MHFYWWRGLHRIEWQCAFRWSHLHLVHAQLLQTLDLLTVHECVCAPYQQLSTVRSHATVPCMFFLQQDEHDAAGQKNWHISDVHVMPPTHHCWTFQKSRASTNCITFFVLFAVLVIDLRLRWRKQNPPFRRRIILLLLQLLRLLMMQWYDCMVRIAVLTVPIFVSFRWAAGVNGKHRCQWGWGRFVNTAIQEYLLLIVTHLIFHRFSQLHK